MTTIRAVAWDGDALILLDQTALPALERQMRCADVDSLVLAISSLVVRGAPALGVVGAYGVAVAMAQGEREGWSREEVARQIARIRDARPTAVNLAAGVDRASQAMSGGCDAVVAEAARLADEDEEANRRLSVHGADWILSRVGSRPVRVLTHCNTGALATSAWGTALGIVRELHGRGVLGLVYADETRPLLQGSRLTAWELEQDGIDYRVQVDSAAASTILRGLVDVAIVGADRIARNADTANKIGTLAIALACRDAGVPFVVAAPSMTIDAAASCGADIPIELRPEDEVLEYAGTRVAPSASRAFNPAFDVTPARLIDAIVTEQGVFAPEDGTDLSELTGIVP